MMKTTILLLTVLGLTTAVFAQKKANESVPEIVRHTFSEQYPGVKAKWNYEQGKYEAGFKYKGHSMSNLYNAAGSLEESELEISPSELPTTVKQYVAQRKLGRIKKAAKITKANGNIEYEAEIKGKDLIFTSEGRFIQAVKD